MKFVYFAPLVLLSSAVTASAQLVPPIEVPDEVGSPRAKAPEASPAKSPTDLAFTRCVRVLRHGNIHSSFNPSKVDAAIALGFLAEDRCIPVLAEQLNHPNDHFRAEVTRALAWMRKPAASDPLLKSLGDSYKFTRMHAATGLGLLKDKRHVESLIAALGDEESVVRDAVVDALGLIGDPRAVPPLIELFAKEKDLFVRRQIIVAFETYKDQRTVETLEGALEDEEPLVRLGAAEALRKITGKRQPIDFGFELLPESP